jgi:hypothetical protein
LTHESPAAILIDNFTAQDFDGAWNAIQELANDPNIKAKARATAEKVFDLNSVGAARYACLYETLLT